MLFVYLAGRRGRIGVSTEQSVGLARAESRPRHDTGAGLAQEADRAGISRWYRPRTDAWQIDDRALVFCEAFAPIPRANLALAN
jgi:hypothetical protein